MDINTINAKMNKKYIGSCCGNSFIILDCRGAKLSKKLKVEFSKKNIDKYGVDSVLFLRESQKADVSIEIFEKDGSESESCGNGAILVSYFLGLDSGSIEMRGGIAMVDGNKTKQAILINKGTSSAKRISNKNNYLFVKIGEPHIVCLVDSLDEFDLVKIGRMMQKKYPKGINVDAIQSTDSAHYLIKTYERGVFAETKSCGTGSLASYLAISHFNDRIYKEPIEFKSAGGSHWVSRNENMLKLETLKKFCKIKSL